MLLHVPSLLYEMLFVISYFFQSFVSDFLYHKIIELFAGHRINSCLFKHLCDIQAFR